MKAIADRPIERFEVDEVAVAAVAYHGIVIGEASGRALSSGHHIEDPQLVVMLEKARSARNEFAHEYDQLEPDNLLATVTNVYLPLREQVRIYLGLPGDDLDADKDCTP